MAFASGKTFSLEDLVPVVDTLAAQPQQVRQALDTGNFSAFSDPEFKHKLDWLALHFGHQLDQDAWLQSQPALPSPSAYKTHLFLTFPQRLKHILNQAIAVESHYFSPQEVRLSVPHDAYLNLHAARLSLSDTQTAAFINQQKLANAAKAIDQLQDQGVAEPDKYQISHQLQAATNHVHTRTASLIRQVNRLDLRLIDQLQHSFQQIINSQPTTIPQSEITTASRELANLSYQTLKPYIPLVSSPADLTTILTDKILTSDRISRIPALAAYKIPPDLFHQVLEATAHNLYRRYVKPLQSPLRLIQTYGESDYGNAFSTTPPPSPAHRQAQDLFLAHGYPGEALLNAADPHAAENAVAHIPQTLWRAVTTPVRLAFGSVETSFVSLAVTYQQQQVKYWAVQRSFSFLPPELQTRWDTLIHQKGGLASPDFEPLFQDTQTWIRSQVGLLHAGSLKVDLDTREKLLEINNNLNLLEFGLKQRAFLEKIPILRNLLHLSDRLSQAEIFGLRIFNPMVTGYTKAFLSLAFRSDPLTAAGIIFDYGAVRPIAQGIWRTALVPLTRHLPFGWDLKQGTFGTEVYWKPAKWLKDTTKESLLWVAEKTGLKKAGEWVAQNIFKTTFAKLAGALSGIFVGLALGWEWFKRGIKAGTSLLFLFLITKGPWYAGWGLAGGVAGLLGGSVVGGILGAKIGAAIGGTLGFGFGGPIGGAAGGLIGAGIGFVVGVIVGLIIAWITDTLWGTISSLFTGSVLPGINQFFASFGSLSLPAIPAWVGPTTIGTFLGLHLFNQYRLNTAFMVPQLGTGGGATVSRYIDVTKTVRLLPSGSPASQLTLPNNQLPFTAEFTVTVTASQFPLSNVSLSDTLTTTRADTTGQPVSTSETLPLSSPPPDSLTSWSTSFTYPFGPTSHPDSLVTNTVTVTADVPGLSSGEQAAATAALVIGNPPVSCPFGWPTTSGYLTQGPQTTLSHKTVEAVDIGVGIGTPVFSASNGTVVGIGLESRNYYDLGCDEEPQPRPEQCVGFGKYGNYIDVLTTCESRPVTVRYAHLDTFAVQPSQAVNFGQPLGESGDTGKSTGSHLHYDFYNRAILMGQPFIPVSRSAILGCEDKASCNTSW